MAEKPSFIVVAYESREAAEQALEVLERLRADKVVGLRDAAIAIRTEQGRVEVEQTRELSAGQGAIAGGVAGTLLGLATGGVVAVALAGLAGGGLLGVFDTGIENDRLRKLADDLPPGHAILGALMVKGDWPRVRDALTPTGGEPVVLELSDEAAAALEAQPPEPAA